MSPWPDPAALAQARDAARAGVRALRATSARIAVVTTGSRGDLGKLLWQPAGASANLLFDRFCYAREETEDFLGFRPASFVSAEVAAALADAAWTRGVALSGAAEGVVGLGMTSAVTTARVRRGPDQAFLALRTENGLRQTHARLRPCPEDADRDAWRAAQGEWLDLAALSLLLGGLGLGALPLPAEALEEGGGLAAPPRATE